MKDTKCETCRKFQAMVSPRYLCKKCSAIVTEDIFLGIYQPKGERNEKFSDSINK